MPARSSWKRSSRPTAEAMDRTRLLRVMLAWAVPLCHSAGRSQGDDRTGDRPGPSVDRVGPGGGKRCTCRCAPAGPIAVAAGLVATTLLPAVGAVRAADPVVLRVGTTQDLDSANPGHVLVVGYEVFQLSYDLLVGFGPELEPVPAFCRVVGAQRRWQGWTFKFRRRTEVVATASRPRPPTPASRGSSAIDAIKARRERRTRLPRPGDQGRGRHEDRVPGSATMIAYTNDPSDRDPPDLRADPAQAHLRQGDLQDDRPTRSFNAAARRDRPVPAVEWTDRRSSPGSCGTRTTGASRASPTRSSSSSSSSATRWSRRSRRGEIDYARGVSPDQFNAAQDRPERSRPSPAARTAGPSSLQHLRDRDRQDDQGRRAVDEGAARPRLPRRARLRGRPAEARRQGPRRLRRRRARPIVPPVLEPKPGTPIRPTPGTFDIEPPSRSSTPPATSSTRRASGSTRKASRSASGWSCPDYDPNSPRPPSSSRTGSASSGSRSRRGPRQRHARRPDAPAGGRRATARPTTTCSSGRWVGDVGPERRCSQCSSATRSAIRPTACAATPTRQALRRAARGADRGRAQGDPRPDAADVLRRGPVYILYYDSTCTPTGPTSSPAGRTSRAERDPALRLRDASATRC